MEAWQVKIINENLFALCQNTKCKDGLRTLLLQMGLITSEEDQHLGTKGRNDSDFAESKLLYETMMTRLNGYTGMMEALKKTQQDAPLKILQDGARGRKLPISANVGFTAEPVMQNLYPVCAKTREPMNETEDVPDQPSGDSGSFKDRSIRDYIRSIQDKLFFKDELPANFTDPVVVLPQEKMQLADDDYKLPTGFKGLLLILNVVKYSANENRKGAAIDTRRLEVVFEALGYEVVKATGCEKIFTREMFADLVDKFKKRCARLEVKSFAVFIGSHGLDGKLQMSDGSVIDLETEVFSKLCTPPDNYHKILENEHWTSIPKMFFIQACRCDAPDDVSAIDNCLISYACEPGSPAWRNADNGSYYVESLTEAHASFACGKDLCKILDIVGATVEEYSFTKGKKGKDIQKPEYYKRGNFGKLYFNLLPSYDNV